MCDALTPPFLPILGSAMAARDGLRDGRSEIVVGGERRGTTWETDCATVGVRLLWQPGGEAPPTNSPTDGCDVRVREIA